MIVLYLETNFLVGCATGRNRLDLDRMASAARFGMAIPGVCFLEALGWMEGEAKRRKAFGRILQEQLVQLKRDLTSPSAAAIGRLIESALVENDQLLQHINERLFDAIARISSEAEIIAVSPAILEASRQTILVEELTDNLIAHCIIEHARRTPGPPKAFFSENHTDFGGSEIQAALRPVGVTYFRDVDRLVGWAGARVLPA